MNNEEAKEIRAARLRELMSRCGVTGVRLAGIADVSTSAVSQWLNGKTMPDRDAYLVMADRWHLSIDSLIGRPGTEGIEPDSLLRYAQALTREEIAKLAETPETPTERLVLAYRTLRRHLPELTVDAWADYLKCDADRWNAIETGFRGEADSQLQGAAFLLGWKDEAAAWEQWFKTGDAGALRGPSETTIRRVLTTLHAWGGGLADIRAAIDARRNK